MKASELRIGNIVRFSNSIEPPRDIVINPWFFKSAIPESPNGDFEITPYYQAIPLTQDWVRKAGLRILGIERNETEYGFNDIDFMLFNKGPIDNLKSFYIKHSDDGERIIEYVHELQNVYFALQGEELYFKI